ncbi:MAG: hypothetical protein AAF639_09865 [Chloroflexota bacterium]
MALRISMNARKVTGPYGGGNQFATNLEAYLVEQGHTVYRTLVPDLDIILIVSSNVNQQTASYNIQAIQDYITLNPNTMVIHRINTCDEPRGMDLGLNQTMLRVNQIADGTIYISNFLRELFAGYGMDMHKPNAVAFNGADENIFYPMGRAEWSSGEKLRIVTHHWSSNYLKGFDIYERLDQLLAIKPYQDLFEFTYIGNIPLGVNFQHTKVIKPIAGAELADALRSQHVYLTAARHEAAGMHHVEGVRCGLPVLFINSGALPEYCHPYGIEFTLINFEQKLMEMHQNYTDYRIKVLDCPYSATWMAEQYEQMFIDLTTNRQIQPEPSILKKLQHTVVTRPQRAFNKVRGLGTKAIKYLR